MDDAVMEAIAEKVHDAWAAEKVRQGFAAHEWNRFGGRLHSGEELCGVSSCGKSKAMHHTDMLSYADLPEHVKNYDRVTARAAIEGITAAGYRLEKNEAAVSSP